MGPKELKALQPASLGHLKTLHSMKNNQRNHIGMFMYLTQVKAALFVVISATSYFKFLGSTPFEITRGIYGQQINYAHTKSQAYSNGIYLVCLATWS